MNYMTISDFKAKAHELDLSDPITVTQNGNPVFVVESHHNWTQRQEAIALLKLLSFSEKDKREGNLVSGNELREGWK